MAIEQLKECWQTKINTVTIGATAEQGGSRLHTVTVGGQTGLPFLSAEAEIPYKPQIAFEIWDILPLDWPEDLMRVYGGCLANPLEWAEKCVEDFNAGLLCIRLQGAHPENENRTPEQEAHFIQQLLRQIKVPIIILGCGDDEKDNAVLCACAEAAKGERCLIGSASSNNYKTLVASCIADGHNVIAQSPIDINIAKQLNILITDIGLSADRIVMDPTVGALGYGLEYAYSIMERARLAAFSGDKMMAMPFICMIGQEAWRSKEARASQQDFPTWGEATARGIIWEATTAVSFLQAGADILVMRHPQAIEKVRQYIELFNI
ncbi:MAG: acetyl-CoA decarbonylase/synthase complex subunit delta [Candidatus Omnitrophica bacterium]|nr:acetyl-CoA decarbonylase/synthase complex subunit delta [Candidatus Omnitrophota bacterium]